MSTALHSDIVAKYEELHEIYKDTSRKGELAEVEDKLYSKDYESAEKKMRTFRTEEELLFALEEKLRGKPIYQTLKKIRRGTIQTKAQILKGLFSLGTHAVIECEHGNVEYMYIVKKIYNKLGQKLNGL